MPNPTYPTLRTSWSDSKRTVRDGRQKDLAGDGLPRMRILHDDRYDFELRHPGLDTTDVATFESFYSTNRTASAIDLTWKDDGDVYVVIFDENAVTKKRIAPGRWDLIVRLAAAG